MIRVIIGLLMAFGAVGTLEVDPDASLVTATLLALAGLGIMALGVAKIQQQNS
jgi:hypothetical protein